MSKQYGNPDDAQNYRGITLINILGKIYTQVLSNRLSKWSEKHDKLSKYQLAFKRASLRWTVFFVEFNSF